MITGYGFPERILHNGIKKDLLSYKYSSVLNWSFTRLFQVVNDGSGILLQKIIHGKNIGYGVVVEYVSGGTLRSHLLKNSIIKRLSLDSVIQLALDVARGLSYLHSKKIVHRDVKTTNLVVDKKGRIKIIDFGVSRVEASCPIDMTAETGTVGYMAPEVLLGLPYDHKCDVYSFGICLWEIYCCSIPYS
ncbi:serine/threonine-protein kinase STY8-like [Capsicum chacoense]|uniref:serine/threonine-protein kinase STY8-like n=1 Tax=Capsicum annuum TaxID=4072 RepID=UPI001FB0F839|nr:serine/threonine-protein kinase STY8-like [Capsicum annuum]